MAEWHLVTGEYPPQAGGVSDYTWLLAKGLAEAGDAVEVWAPFCQGRPTSVPGVTVHRLPGHFGPRALAQLGTALSRRSGGRLLVQYVPHMYGWKAMNLAFCSWLLLRCPVSPWVMFHEVAFPVRAGQPLRHNVLGAVQHAMASLVARAAARVFVSIPAWEGLLRRLAPLKAPVTWLPIPSTVALDADAAAVAAVRARLAPGPGGLVLGHFGTFGGPVARPLTAALESLLAAAPGRVALLLGRGSEAFAGQFLDRRPSLRGRVQATGELRAGAVAAHLRACDVLLQPYPDGVSSRRTSFMAGLALGCPTVTTLGPLSEPLWQRQDLAEAVPVEAPDDFVRRTEGLLQSPQRRHQLGRQARAGYRQFFSLQRTIQTLRGSP
jgi:glycosyltransferase involved in cell wall biosynthesis